MSIRSSTPAASRDDSRDPADTDAVVTDDVLLERLRRGDSDAAKALYVRYFERLMRFANSHVHSRESSEDIVQDVFFALWEARATLVIRDNLRVYLYAAVRHRALNRIAHDRIVMRAEEVTDRDEMPIGMGTAIARPDEQVEADALVAAIVRAIAALPEKRRMAFLLRWRHQLPYQEIARIMDASVSAVTVHVARARASIARLIQGYTDR